MTVEVHDAATPYAQIDAEAETQKDLCERFKGINWWARNRFFSLLVIALYSVAGLKGSNGIEHPGDADFFFITFFGTLLGLLAFMVAAEYFFHYMPWKKYKEEWSLKDSKWSANIGGILKIYD